MSATERARLAAVPMMLVLAMLGGTPIVYSSGALQIATPAGWFLACALLCELFIPAYLDNRRLA